MKNKLMRTKNAMILNLLRPNIVKSGLTNPEVVRFRRFVAKPLLLSGTPLTKNRPFRGLQIQCKNKEAF